MLTQNEYFAVDSEGNELALEEWLAEKKSKQTTKIITQMSRRKITTFKEVLNTAPVMAFHNEKKVRRFIQIINNEHARKVDYPGFRKIREDWSSFNYRARKVYENISF